jgi:hypothetical protein
MRISDYCLCFIAADLISSGLVNLNPIVSVVGIAAYFSWERLRTMGDINE